MQILLTIIAVVIIFSIIVVIHEAGHFFAARRAGIKVLEFGIGFPPRIFKKKIGEMIFSINAIPFGGFVKLYGEDAVNTQVLEDKESFASKSPWIRTKVVLAGVVMNFVLAVFLLALGFSFGIEPLLVTQDDLFASLRRGTVITAPGLYVHKVSKQATESGIKPGDKIIMIDDKPIEHEAQASVFKKGGARKDIDLTLEAANGSVRKVHLPVNESKNLGVELKPFNQFPRLVVFELKPGSVSERVGLKPEDVILNVNDQEIYSFADFEKAVTEDAGLQSTFKILRGAQILTLTVPRTDNRKIIIEEVIPGSRAEKAGFNSGDILVSINGAPITRPAQVTEMLKEHKDKTLEYKLYRGGKELTISVAAAELGISISTIHSYLNVDLSVYRGAVITSLTEIKKVRYSPLIALREAVSESVRLTGYTISAFVSTIKQVVSKLTVPAGIGGPVQIAYFTHTFVEEGFFALLRFTALLSLSLAVINVLPIPALDGGRLLFILIEVVFKKRVNARTEAFVHGIGFILLLLFIGVITYSDIVKLF